MATHVIEDQNLNVHYNGAPNSNVSKPQKKGGIAGRKALNDITNSGKPSALQVSKKGGIAGRKALNDITNSGKPSALQVSKKTKAKNLSSVAEENLPNDIGEEEGLRHNHDECIKAYRKSKALDMEYFWKTVGLDNDKSVHSACPWVLPVSKNSNVSLEIEMKGFSDNSPTWGSPRSPEPDFMMEMDYPTYASPRSPESDTDVDYELSDFSQIELPDLELIDTLMMCDMR